MVLTSTDVLNILKNKPYGKYLEIFRKESKRLTAHMTGEGNDSLIEKVSGLENDKQLEIRKQFARSNKDIFARIHRPEDKIYTAKGGSKVYDLPANLQKDFIGKLQNVYNGISITKWVESFAHTYYHIDPMGIVLIEISQDGLNAYPTYKSTSTIYDYKTKGRSLEYVVLNTDKKDVYRVIDDVSDTLYKYTGGESVDKMDVLPNYFGEVPALIVSDILRKNTEFYESPDNEIIQLADEFLRECSVKSIFKLKHGFPKAWQYAGACPDCKGTGHLNADDCKSCNGSGNAVTKDASQIITLPLPEENQPTIAPNVAGFVSPDVDGWDKMSEELASIENLMHSTYWGIKDKVKTVGIGSEKTATEIIDDMQPLNDRLTKFSNWAESIEKYITDKLGEFYYQKAYKGSSISNGKRFILESYDKIWEKYQNARKQGSPLSVLDTLMRDYLESRFDSNQMELNKHLKLMKVEPFVHQTISECKNTVTDFMQYNRKVYYHEWVSTLSEVDILVKDAKQLNNELTIFVDNKGLKEPETKIQ